MPLEPTHEELVEMQRTHDALERANELQQKVLSDPQGPEELLRRLVDPRGKPGPSEMSRLIWQESRYWAAKALARMEKERAVPMLLQALKSEHHSSVQAAMKYLGRLKDPAAVPALVTALRHPSENIRRSAALALGEIATPAAVEALGEAVKDPELGGSAAFKLLEIGSPEAVEAVASTMSHPSLGAHLRKEAYVVVSLAHRFCRNPDPRFIEALHTLLKDPNLDYREEVKKALSLIEHLSNPRGIRGASRSKDSDSESSGEGQVLADPNEGTGPLRILRWILCRFRVSGG